MGFLDRLRTREDEGGRSARSQLTSVPRTQRQLFSDALSSGNTPFERSQFQLQNFSGRPQEVPEPPSLGPRDPEFTFAAGVEETSRQAIPPQSPEQFLEGGPATFSANQTETELNQVATQSAEDLRNQKIRRDQLDRIAETPMLSNQSIQGLATARAEIDVQIADTEAMIADIARVRGLKREMNQTQEDIMFGPGGVLDGIEGVTEGVIRNFNRENAQLGVGPEFLRMGEFIARDPNLTTDEKNERLQFLINRGNDKNAALTEIDNLVENKVALRKLANMPDAELAEATGIDLDFLNPVTGFNIDFDPFMRQGAVIDGTVQQLYSVSEFTPTPLADQQLAGLINGLVNGEIPLEGLRLQIEGWVQQHGQGILTADQVFGAVTSGFDASVVQEQQFANVKSVKNFTPGSLEFGQAIFQAAMEEGLPPELADAWAGSRQFHMLLDAVSGANIGGPTRGGDLKGIGGLPAVTYDVLGFQGGYEGVRGDTLLEIQAVIRYILARYSGPEGPGDPNMAYRDFFATGEWGN